MSLFYPLVSFYSLPFTMLMLFNKGASNEVTTSDDETDSLVCRFVVDGNGKRIGESIGIAGDILIIKEGARFLGVPLKHIEEQETLLLVKGLVDFRKAYELGEKWRSDSTHEISDGVDDEEK